MKVKIIIDSETLLGLQAALLLIYGETWSIDRIALEMSERFDLIPGDQITMDYLTKIQPNEASE